MTVIGRGRAHREVVLGPVRLKEGTLVLRSPRLRDAPAWSAARLANREWLERAFPAWGDDWAAEQSPAAWIARWRHLQHQRAEVGARPFVLLLDGELIGELGIDAVDTVSGGGEASVWMVRDHGSAGVMNVASLLLIQHAFGGEDPMDRLISPVATTSRKGRAPGLTAVGFDIEATLPRPVGRGVAVDHDIWVLHNSPAVRDKADRALAAMSGAGGPASAGGNGGSSATAATWGQLAPAVARVAVREVRTGARRVAARRDRPAADVRRTVGVGEARVTVDSTGQVTRDGTAVGHLATSSDLGTATATLRPRLDTPDAGPALAAAAGTLADDVTTWAPGSRWVEIRLTPSAAGVGDHLNALGFEHVASFRGNPDGPRRWTGEHCWLREV